MRKQAAIALIATLGLAGCDLAPRYQRPAPAIPAQWPKGTAYPANEDAALPTIDYRDIFRDPALRTIIEHALANNQDIRVALGNVAAARGQLRVARSELLPHLDASGGVTIRDASNANGGGTGNGTSGSTTSYSADIGLTAFEIDLFGRLRNQSKAAFEEYLASEAGARAARLSIVAQVADAYLTLAADRSLLAIAIDTEDNAGRSVQLTRARLEGGIAPRTDLRQAETILAQAQADRAALTTLVAQDRNALELLVGAPVSDALLPSSIEQVDGLLAELPAGLDSAILLRRPDVAQAEYGLRAANARIGAARAAFFPRLSLTALAGFASTALSSLFDHGAFTWSVAPSATLPIFDAGANSGNLAYAKAQRDIALAQYQRAIQTAFREVADALARRGTIAEEIRAQTQLEAAARDSYQLAEARYRGGISSFLDSLDAQRTLYSARRSLASTRLVRASNLVALYRTLGGDVLIASDKDAADRPR